MTIRNIYGQEFDTLLCQWWQFIEHYLQPRERERKTIGRNYTQGKVSARERTTFACGVKRTG
jgi:hypothetical protein